MRAKYIIKKSIYALITIFLIIIFNYFLFRVIPGDPLSMVMRNPKATEEAVQKTIEMYGLDKSWYEQFFIYLKDLFHGDLGMSFEFKRPVMEVIGPKVLPTVILFGVSEILAIIFGIFMGIVSAWKRGTKLDVTILSVSLFTYSMPVFWLGMILVAVFAVNLGWFPTGGITSPGVAIMGGWAHVSDIIWHGVLPVITMAVLIVGEYALTMRNTLIDVLGEDYITTAKAKGFSERYILRKHAFPNAMLPMVTIIAINLGFVIGGAVQIETVFSWPGLGNLMYDALGARDYPVLQGLFLLITICVVLANYIADISYSYIDPRVKNEA
ncbi:MAG: ABC transporter permease [Eubacteriales bacterium]|nr:ABC transporter permease [Eubacteriales bacterium]